jgi:branched-subunit amino acid aminotransferase/4-amino-4-deoxychorismate lyase
MHSPSNEKFLNSYALQWNPTAKGFELVTSSGLSIPATDLGTMYGAVLVERTRTFGKKFLDLEPHKNRLKLGLATLGLKEHSFFQQLDHAIEELIANSTSLLKEESDASLCIVVTPGDYFTGRELHAFAHWLPIPWEKLANWYQTGTTLVRVQYASGAGECWPSNIKTRSRLNYYLADQDATKRFQGGLGLLCTSRGMVSDTSVANLLLVDQQGNIVSPRREDIVAGTSLDRIERMLKEDGKSIFFRDVLFEELYDASEVLLVGNTGCIWHASSFQRRIIGDKNPGPVCLRLQKQWCQAIGFDWKSQAIRKATTSS